MKGLLKIRGIQGLILVLVVAICIPPVAASAPATEKDQKIREAPVNPSFLAYKMGPQGDATIKVNGKLKTLGYIPSPVDKSHLKGWKLRVKNGIVSVYDSASQKNGVVSASDSATQSSGSEIVTFPATYDLRTLGRVSPVKDQGSCCACWAFATYGSLESNQLPAQLLDLSENNLKNTHGFDIGACSGGNAEFSAAYLTRWSGPADEAADPYNVTSSVSPGGLQPETYTQEVYYLPDRVSATDNDEIKTALQTYGGVYSTMYWTSSSYNPANQSYYYSGTSGANHAITIVGWDDNYDKARFAPAAPANGAFIAKNSWGSSWGASGYFYISFYDAQIGKGNVVFTSEATPGYDLVYQYDPLGWITSVGYGTDTAWFGNVFTATSEGVLSAVGFYTPQINSNYQVSVYSNPSAGPVNTTGTVASFNGVIALPGYHTVSLPAPVQLTKDKKFSVVVRLQTPGYTYPVAVEAPFSGYSSQATADAGRSWVSSDGSSWRDLTSYSANRNVCLKAYTRSSTSVDNPVPVLSGLLPSSATAGDAALPLTVTGSGFVPGSVLWWNGANRVTNYGSATQITASIPASDIATAGTAEITVFNPVPGGGTSGALTFTINNPGPVLKALTPPSTAAGSPAFTLLVNGSNFVSGSQVYWKGAARTTRFVGMGLLSADILSTDVISVGSASVIVTNPAPGGGTSGTSTFTITEAQNPVPTVTSLSPASSTAGGEGFVLTVNGRDFVAGSKIQWNGADRTTTYSSPNVLTAAIVPADIQVAGTAPVIVFNPAPGGGPSNAAAFTIVTPTNPVPTITGISPSAATAGGEGFIMTVSGTNFVPGSVVRWNGNDRTTTYTSFTELTASIPATDVGSAGTAYVTVFNPAPGGGVSVSPKTFTISPAAPVRASFTALPTSGRAPLDVKFTDTSTGNPTGWSWTFGDGTSSTLQHPSHLYTSAGSYRITLTVTNGASSNTIKKTGYIRVRKIATIRILGGE